MALIARHHSRFGLASRMAASTPSSGRSLGLALGRWLGLALGGWLALAPGRSLAIAFSTGADYDTTTSAPHLSPVVLPGTSSWFSRRFRRLPMTRLARACAWLALQGVLLVPAGPVHAQTTLLVEYFTCSNEPSFGDPAGVFGWDSNLSGDTWATDLGDGVSPSTDEATGSFGAPVDNFENFLLTGHVSTNDVAIEADLTNDDDDAAGLVVRYSGPGSYYACYMTTDQAPSCLGGGAAVGDRVALVRVDSGNPCATYIEDSTTSFGYTQGETYRMRLEVIGNDVTCSVDVNQNGAFADPTDVVLTLMNDGMPLPSGLVGLYNFDNGNGDTGMTNLGQMVFDNVVIQTYDPDGDGDGLSDAVEADLGTDPDAKDSDGDFISDTDEASMAEHPANTDGSGEIDPLDEDSDGDGVPDALEAGDKKLGTPPPDSDCDGLADFRDEDSDDDGTPDGDEDDDKDGLTAAEEVDAGTDLGDADSDDDGVLDGDEPKYDKDTDGDGEINALDPDSDDDGLFDGTELGVKKAPADTDKGAGHFVADADPKSKTDPLDDDTDAGSVQDGIEDANKNGRIDAGETDPNLKSDDVPGGDPTSDAGVPSGMEGPDAGMEPTGMGAPGSDKDGSIDLGETNPNDASDDVVTVLEGGGLSCTLASAGTRRSFVPVAFVIGIALPVVRRRGARGRGAR